MSQEVGFDDMTEGHVVGSDMRRPSLQHSPRLDEPVKAQVPRVGMLREPAIVISLLIVIDPILT